MNFGTNDIESVIWEQLKKGNARITGYPPKKFVRDLASQIYLLTSGEKTEEKPVNIDMKTQARAMGIPDEILKFSERTGRALGFTVMQLDPVSIEAYQWIMDQERYGQTVEAFANWARKDEDGKFIGKYRKSAGAIRNDWVRAFGSKVIEWI